MIERYHNCKPGLHVSRGADILLRFAHAWFARTACAPLEFCA
jgi:hypothetical protein